MNKALEWFSKGWMVVVVAVNAYGLYRIFSPSSGLWDAWLRLRDTVNPYNFWYIGLEFLLVLPIACAEVWLGIRKEDEAYKDM